MKGRSIATRHSRGPCCAPQHVWSAPDPQALRVPRLCQHCLNAGVILGVEPEGENTRVVGAVIAQTRRADRPATAGRSSTQRTATVVMPTACRVATSLSAASSYWNNRQPPQASTMRLYFWRLAVSSAEPRGSGWLRVPLGQEYGERRLWYFDFELGGVRSCSSRRLFAVIGANTADVEARLDQAVETPISAAVARLIDTQTNMRNFSNGSFRALSLL